MQAGGAGNRDGDEWVDLKSYIYIISFIFMNLYINLCRRTMCT